MAPQPNSCLFQQVRFSFISSVPFVIALIERRKTEVKKKGGNAVKKKDEGRRTWSASDLAIIKDRVSQKWAYKKVYAMDGKRKG